MNPTTKATLSFDEAIMQCTNTLQSKNNPEQSLALLLNILGEFYQASASYIFEINKETQIFERNYQWDEKENVEFSNILHDFPAEELNSFNTIASSPVPIMTMEPKKRGNSAPAAVFDSFESIMISPILHKGKPESFVAITNINLEEFDNRLFECAILFISECLQKREMYLQLALLHDLDPLTGFFNKTQFLNRVEELVATPEPQLGIVFVQMAGLENIGEIYGAKYVDVKIKNAAILMGQYFELPFYRIDTEKFICFAPDVEETSFRGKMDRMRLETTADKNASFVVAHTWSEKNYDLEEELEKGYNALEGLLSVSDDTTIYSSKDSLERDLSQAIESCYFLVHLQPKVELSTLKTVGAEVLARRYIPESKNLVPLDSFIPLYEQHDIIQELDLHILKKVCAGLSKRKKNHFKMPVSVHLSRVTLMSPGMAGLISDMCNKYNVARSLIEIHLTERLGVMTEKLSTSVVAEFKEEGLNLVLENVGSTYSNYLTLTKVNIKESKEEEILVDHEAYYHNNQEILKNIIDMCEAIGNINTLEASHEEKIQKELSNKLNCEYGHAFYYSHPIAMDEFFEQYAENE